MIGVSTGGRISELLSHNRRCLPERCRCNRSALDTNSPYEPQYFGRQILDISKYSMYTDREVTKRLKLEEIDWVFKIRAMP